MKERIAKCVTGVLRDAIRVASHVSDVFRKMVSVLALTHSISLIFPWLTSNCFVLFSGRCEVWRFLLALETG